MMNNAMKTIASENTDTTMIKENNMTEQNMNITESIGKTKVFLSFVGESDPYPTGKQALDSVPVPEIENMGALVTLCREIKPDIAYIFPSSRTGNPSRNTHDRAEAAQRILAEIMPEMKCRIMPLEISDATDFDQISREWWRGIKSVTEELGDIDQYEFHLNCTSATQQMTAVAYSFANSGRLPGIIRWQSKDPRFLAPGELRNKMIRTAFMEENSCFERISAAADKMNFISVAENCRRLTEIVSADDRKRRSVFTGMKGIFEALASLDNMRCQSACDKLAAEIEKLEAIPGVLTPEARRTLERQAEYLSHMKVQCEHETPHNLIDLIFNMRRSFIRGNYVDVLARFWRLREGVLYFRMASNGFDKRNINPDSPAARKVRNGKYGNTVNWDIPQPRFKSENLDVYCGILKSDFGDIFVDSFEKLHKSKLEVLRKRRNKTIVAHGMLPVERADAQLCCDIAEALIPLIPDGEKLHAGYPFTQEHICTLIDMLKQI